MPEGEALGGAESVGVGRGEAVPPEAYYFRTAVRFTTGAPAWLHLNKLIAIAVGQREASVVKLNFYRLT